MLLDTTLQEKHLHFRKKPAKLQRMSDYSKKDLSKCPTFSIYIIQPNCENGNSPKVKFRHCFKSTTASQNFFENFFVKLIKISQKTREKYLQKFFNIRT